MKRKREQRRPRAWNELSRRIVLLAFGMWLAAMAILTWAVASDMYIQAESGVREYAWDASDMKIYNGNYKEGLPGDEESDMLHLLNGIYYYLDFDQLFPFVLPQKPSSMSSSDWYWGKWKMLWGYESAGIFYDENGEILIQSGNYWRFSYTSEENWRAKNSEPIGTSYINLDILEGDLGELERYLPEFNPLGDSFASHFLPVLRLTGYFEGNEFHPVVIDRGQSPYDSMSNDVEDLLAVSSRIQWENLLTNEAATDQELVTVYGWNLSAITSDLPPLTVRGQRFDSLTELLHEDYSSDESYERNSLWDAIFVRRTSRRGEDGKVYNFAVAVRCWPLQYAALRLIPAYLVSLVIVAFIVWCMLRKIRMYLTEPLEYLISMTAAGISLEPNASWEEPYQLEKYAADSGKNLAEAKNEIKQLQTALDYARDAEENRKQLISNITHELKTPLAVIRSYAEGLKVGIAKEKQEKYLEVILEETDQMDNMVLQMLDLSRLEAGKVHLASDQFSLAELTRETAEKFLPMLEKKEIKLCYNRMDDVMITADEGRLGQVLTNLISNAVKYTSQGGNIWVDVYVCGRDIRFSIENTAAPLSEEALSKVWDSFYRADPSRTEPGTGLGLTLVKSIVELHRGKCYVRNTKSKEDPDCTSVEFGFEIPLK